MLRWANNNNNKNNNNNTQSLIKVPLRKRSRISWITFYGATMPFWRVTLTNCFMQYEVNVPPVKYTQMFKKNVTVSGHITVLRSLAVHPFVCLSLLFVRRHFLVHFPSLLGSNISWNILEWLADMLVGKAFMLEGDPTPHLVRNIQGFQAVRSSQNCYYKRKFNKKCLLKKTNGIGLGGK